MVDAREAEVNREGLMSIFRHIDELSSLARCAAAVPASLLHLITRSLRMHANLMVAVSQGASCSAFSCALVTDVSADAC